MTDPMDEVFNEAFREFCAAELPFTFEPQAAPDPAEVLANFRRFDEILKANQRTVVCRPELEDSVREAVDRSGVAGFYTVQSSDICPPGAVFIVKEPRL